MVTTPKSISEQQVLDDTKHKNSDYQCKTLCHVLGIQTHYFFVHIPEISVDNVRVRLTNKTSGGNWDESAWTHK